MWITNNVRNVTLYSTVSKGYLLLYLKLGSKSRYIVTKCPLHLDVQRNSSQLLVSGHF